MEYLDVSPLCDYMIDSDLRQTAKWVCRQIDRIAARAVNESEAESALTIIERHAKHSKQILPHASDG